MFDIHHKYLYTSLHHPYNLRLSVVKSVLSDWRQTVGAPGQVHLNMAMVFINSDKNGLYHENFDGGDHCLS